MKHLFIVFMFLSTVLTTFSQQVEVEVVRFALGAHYYGNNIEIQRISFTEATDSSFNVGVTGTISINAMEGFYFKQRDLIVPDIDGSGDFINVPSITLDNDSTKIIITFFTNAPSNEQTTISLNNITLVPIADSTTYGNTLTFNKSNTAALSKAYEDITPPMEVPTINWEFGNGQICSHAEDTLTIDVDGVTKATIQDVSIEYINYANDTIRGNIQNDASSPSSNFIFPINDLTSDTDTITVTTNFNNGWTKMKILTVGDNSSSDSIKVTLANPVNLKPLSTSIFTKYSDKVPLTDFVEDDTSNYKFLEGDGGLKDGSLTNTHFIPQVANTGINNIKIQRTTGTCSISRTVELMVIPDIITANPIYCFNEGQTDKTDTVMIASDAISSYDTVGKKYSFRSFQITTIDTTLTFTNDTAEGGFYKYAFNASGLHDTQEDQTDIGFRLEVDISLLREDYILKNTIIIPVELSLDFYRNLYDSVAVEREVFPGVYEVGLYDIDWVEYANTASVIETDAVKVVTPATDGSLVNFETIYCPTETPILLTTNANYSIDSVVSRNNADTILKIADNDYWHYLPYKAWDSVSTTTDSVILYYKDNNGCLDTAGYEITINTLPEFDFSANGICIGDTTLFTSNLTVNGTGEIEQWIWEFGDGFELSNSESVPVETPVYAQQGKVTGTYENPKYYYNAPGEYPIHLRAILNTGCTDIATDTIIIGEHPVIDISYQNKLLTEPTIFTNNTTARDFDSITTYKWNFDDSALDSAMGIQLVDNDNPIEINYETAGVHAVSLTAETVNRCVSDTILYVPSFPLHEIDSIQPYEQLFSSAAQQEGWIASQHYNMLQAAGWKYIPVQGIFNDGDNHTEGYMWQTGDPADSIDNETGWLESPCFDLSEIKAPMISVDIFQSVEEGRDGAVLQYTTNDGVTWRTLGNHQAGSEWYNRNGIFSEPGKERGLNEGWLGWSENTNAWSTARHPLEEVKDSISGDECVRFRIAYSSNDYHNTTFGGFGVDNFRISKRKRIVLLEEFVNSEMPESLTNIDNFLLSRQDEICPMNYHMINGHKKDVLADEINWQDVSARATEYGANKASERIFDGLIAKEDSDIENEFTRRTLTDPAFEISNVNISRDGDYMQISARIEKLTNLEEEYYGPHKRLVRVAIVQKEMADENGAVYDNVVVELLPSGVGNVVETISGDFLVGDFVDINATWIPNVRTIDNDYRVVIFVQAQWGIDEVQQVWFKDVSTDIVPQVEEGLSSTNTEQSDRFAIYPNPVKTKLHITAAYSLSEDVNWVIYTINGRAIKQGTMYLGDNEEVINVEDLAKGLYLVELQYSNGTRISKKIAKVVD